MLFQLRNVGYQYVSTLDHLGDRVDSGSNPSAARQRDNSSPDLSRSARRSGNVLDGVSCDILQGGVVAILGPSGCGKSTLLHLLGLLLEDLPGQFELTGRNRCEEHESAVRLLYRGHDYLALDRESRRQLRREEFGYVLQSCYLLANFTAIQNVAMPLAVLGWSDRERHAWAETLISAVDRNGDLARRLHRLPRQLSQGQRQRLAVLRAIIHNPSVIFADEPTSNLDPLSTWAVLDLLREWVSGELHRRGIEALPKESRLRKRLEDLYAQHDGPRTLLLVCHHLETARRVADHVILFDNQHRIIASFSGSDWQHYDHLIREVLSPDDVSTEIKDSSIDILQPAPLAPIDDAPAQKVKSAKKTHHRLSFALGFAAWFSYRELWTSGVRLVTMVMIATMALAAMGAIVSIVAPEFIRRVNLAELERNPFTRCLWVAGRGFSREIYEEKRSQLEAALRVVNPSVLVTGYYEESSLEISDLPPALTQPKGRVVIEGDPLYDKLPVLTKHGRSFSDTTTPAAILSSRMLSKLLHKDEDDPKSLRVRMPQTGETISLPILDFSNEPFPQGDLYYLNEAADEYLRQIDHREGATSRIYSGFIPDDWPKADESLPARVMDALRVWKIKEPVVTEVTNFLDQSRRRYWTLEANLTYASKEWLTHLKSLRQYMVEAGFSDADEFPVVRDDSVTTPPVQPRTHFDRIVVTVDTIDDLRPIAEKIEDSGFYVNDSAITQLRLIETTARRQRMVALGLAILFCLGSMMSLAVMLFLRAQQKAAQCGMLRALGASDSTLRQIAVAEAVMIWLVGTCLGFLLCTGLAGIVGTTQHMSFQILINSVCDFRTIGVLVVYLVVSCLACLIGSLIASHRFRRMSPAIAMTLGGS